MAEVKENDPTLPSGSDQLTVHRPGGGICVRATDTVLRSAPNCGAARPTSVPSQASTSLTSAADSGLANGSRNTIWIWVGATSTTWLAAGLEEMTSLVPAVASAVPASKEKKMVPSGSISTAARSDRRSAAVTMGPHQR